MYSGPPLMQPPLGNGKSGRIRGVAAGNGGEVKDKNIKLCFTKSRPVCVIRESIEITCRSIGTTCTYIY